MQKLNLRNNNQEEGDSMNNLEKEIQDKTAEEIYDFLWFLFHDYGCSFTDSRKAIIEWIDGKREMNHVLYDYKFGDVQKKLIESQQLME